MIIKHGDEVLYETTEWDDTARIVLHLGIPVMTNPILIKDLIERLQDSHPHSSLVYVEGDGWNCWGEKPGTDINDETTYHVVIPVSSPRHGQQIVTELLEDQYGFKNLIPMQQPWWDEDHAEVIAVVTDGQDWSRYQHHLSWEYDTKDREVPSGVVFSGWPEGRKAYHIEIADEDTEALENWLAYRSAEIIDIASIDPRVALPVVRTDGAR